MVKLQCRLPYLVVPTVLVMNRFVLQWLPIRTSPESLDEESTNRPSSSSIVQALSDVVPHHLVLLPKCSCSYRQCVYNSTTSRLCSSQISPMTNKGRKIVVSVLPETLRWDALIRNHNIPTAGHQGVKKTLQRCKEEANCVNMALDVEQHCCECITW